MKVTYRDIYIARPTFQKIINDDNIKIGGSAGIDLVNLIVEVNRELEAFSKSLEKIQSQELSEEEMAKETVNLPDRFVLDKRGFAAVDLSFNEWNTIAGFFK